MAADKQGRRAEVQVSGRVGPADPERRGHPRRSFLLPCAFVHAREALAPHRAPLQPGLPRGGCAAAWRRDRPARERGGAGARRAPHPHDRGRRRRHLHRLRTLRRHPARAAAGGADPEVVAGRSRERERIDRIVRSLLDYARPQDEALGLVDTATVVRGAYVLLEAQGALKPVRAALEIVRDVPPVLGRAHLMEQSLVNLVLNAVDAAPGGTVVVGARRWDFEPDRVPRKRANDPGRSAFPRTPERRPTRIEFAPGQPGALIYVADSGSGVPGEDRDKVFEPFYTTKEPGRGTGLGLAIVARVVHEMGGVVWVDRAREGGAAFKLFFPAAGGP